MVALQSLNLSVGVRVPVPQPKKKDTYQGVFFLSFWGLEPQPPKYDRNFFGFTIGEMPSV